MQKSICWRWHPLQSNPESQVKSCRKKERQAKFEALMVRLAKEILPQGMGFVHWARPSTVVHPNHCIPTENTEGNERVDERLNESVRHITYLLYYQESAASSAQRVHVPLVPHQG